MHNKPIGKKIWAGPGGNMPFQSHGNEPAFTSRDWIAVLNASNRDAKIDISIYYANSDPVTGFQIKVKANRVRKIRFNDLIDPLPVPLAKPYAFVLTSSVEVVVQFNRMNTGHRDIAITGTTGYYE